MCSKQDSVIEVSYLYTFLNGLLGIVCNGTFCYFTGIKYRNVNIFTCNYFHGKCSQLLGFVIFMSALLIGLIFIVILRCCQNKECCGVPLTKKENLYFNEQIEQEYQSEEEAAYEMKEVSKSTELDLPTICNEQEEQSEK